MMSTPTADSGMLSRYRLPIFKSDAAFVSVTTSVSFTTMTDVARDVRAGGRHGGQHARELGDIVRVRGERAPGGGLRVAARGRPAAQLRAAGRVRAADAGPARELRHRRRGVRPVVARAGAVADGGRRRVRPRYRAGWRPYPAAGSAAT